MTFGCKSEQYSPAVGNISMAKRRNGELTHGNRRGAENQDSCTMFAVQLGMPAKTAAFASPQSVQQASNGVDLARISMTLA